MEKNLIKRADTYSDFKGMLEEIESKDVWKEDLSADIRVSVDPSGDFVLSDGDDETVLHDLAVTTLLDRAGVKGILSSSLLKKETEDKDLLAKIVNLGLGHFGNKPCKTLVRDGLVMAVHGSQYSVMPQSVGMDVVDGSLHERFDGAQFIDGEFTYEKTTALYRVASPGDPIFSDYEKAWKTAGLNTKALDKTSGYVKVETSDVGESCFSIIPYIVMRDKWMPLSSPLEVKHRGKNETAMLSNCVDKCFNLLSDSFSKELPPLMSRVLSYPQQALVRIIHKLGISAGGSKTLAESMVQSFERRYDTYSTKVNEYGITVPSEDRDTLTAFDLYCFFMEMQYTADFVKLSEITKIRIIEKLYTIPSLDWDKLDQDGARYL